MNAQPCTVITGANGGLGQEFVKLVAKNTTQTILLVGRNKAELETIASDTQTTNTLIIVLADLENTAQSIKKIAESLEKNKLWVETLINNAGFGAYGAFTQTDGQKEQEMIIVNIATLTALTKLVLPEMKKHNRGQILNVASVASFLPGPYMAVYYATKAYVLSFTLALREELRDTNIRITALCPGPTETGFAKLADAQKASIFRGTLATAQDVAEFGWNALQKNKDVAIYGWRNRVTIALTRIVPLSLVARMVGKLQKPA